MRLSILIPPYNYDCTSLVRQLLLQLPEDAEIIVGDDCSIVNCQLSIVNDKLKLFRPSHNLGRAGIRNALAREAKGDWLLFIDADAEVRSKTFIADYLKSLPPRGEVWKGAVCGGTGNLPECPRPEARLRYDYEVKTEKRLTLEHRRKHPYTGFTTFNFLVQRNLFLSIGFDESLKRYGHEDTLFGLELKKRVIPILHIDNKLTHLGLEDADVYLKKTETALRTLASMSLEQRQNVRVSSLALRLQHWHLLWLIRFLFKMTKPLLRSNLLGKHPSQHLFAFYKLGFYTHC
ncbi:MAG: glycosyltransferase family 2 protein [Bacteroidaceae bacterium]|nr:glycosyltransferase family 2 protein [Bacteroidaceae bacterium]